jgi:predicted GNAT family acetyltransferase
MPIPYYMPHLYAYGGGHLFWFPGGPLFGSPVEDVATEQVVSKPDTAVTSTLLDNPIWSALTGQQAHLALGGKLARRYPPEMAAIAAVSHPERAAFAELATLIAAGETVYLAGSELGDIESQLPSSLKIKHQASVIQMVYSRPSKVAMRAKNITILSEADVPEMLKLVSLAQPGPFLVRAHKMGTYLGIRQQGQLVAMAGERMHLAGYREISTICTHPDFQGRGYARQLISQLVNLNLDQGNTPFLHVMNDNKRAKSIYESMGFVERSRISLVVLQRGMKS